MITTHSDISIVRPTSAADWDAFVDGSPTTTGYHLWHWRDAYERAFGHRTEHLAAVEDGRIVGVLPLVIFESWMFCRFAVSLPFVNYGGVVAEHDDAARSLFDAALQLGHDRRLRHVELRHRVRRFADVPAKCHKVAMLRPLSGERAMWEGLDRKVRNQVRKAEKSGLTAHIGGEEL